MKSPMLFSLACLLCTPGAWALQQVVRNRANSTIFGFDCAAHPKLCESPFECGSATLPSIIPNIFQGVAQNGPNLQLWCAATEYENYVSECLAKKDLVSAAHTQYNDTVAGRFGPFTHELDGSYCFIEGHCLNEAVSSTTTLEEAAQMCDDRYGHERWASFGNPLSQISMVRNVAPAIVGATLANLHGDPSGGFTGQSQTTDFLLAACAMGNYHCDVVYCKETYCKNEYYIKKYGHFLEELGWTSSTASWMHA